MTEQSTELPEDLVDPDQAPDPVDNGVAPEDGSQDVDQEPWFEEAETDDNEDDNDPEVGQVY
jgi:hypothetical protein